MELAGVPTHKTQTDAATYNLLHADELTRESYDLLTMTASRDHLRSSKQPSPSFMQQCAEVKDSSSPDAFRWSGRLSRILKQAGLPKIPRNPLSSSVITVSREPSFPAGVVRPDRTPSMMSTGSGISALESLAALSQRILSSGGGTSNGSPPSSPGRRFLRRHVSASLRSRSLSSHIHRSEDNNKLSLSLKVCT